MIHGNVIETMTKEELAGYIRLKNRTEQRAVDVCNETEILKNLYIDIVDSMKSFEAAKEVYEESKEDIREFERKMEHKYSNALPENLRAYYEEEGDDDKDN